MHYTAMRTNKLQLMTTWVNFPNVMLKETQEYILEILFI